MSHTTLSRAAVVRTAGTLHALDQQANVTAVATLLGIRPRTLSRILRCDMPDVAASARIDSYPGCGGRFLHTRQMQLYLSAVTAIHSRHELPTMTSLAHELNKSVTAVQTFCHTHRDEIKHLFSIYSTFEAHVYRIGRARCLRNAPTTRAGLIHEAGCSRIALYQVLKRHPSFVTLLKLDYKGRWATRTQTRRPDDGLGARRNVHCVRFSRNPEIVRTMDMPNRIVRAVAARYGICAKSLTVSHGLMQRRRCRKKLISMVAIYLIKEETEATFEAIGEMFNITRQAAANSHTTIAKSAEKLEPEFVYIRDLCSIPV